MMSQDTRAMLQKGCLRTKKAKVANDRAADLQPIWWILDLATYIALEAVKPIHMTQQCRATQDIA